MNKYKIYVIIISLFLVSSYQVTGQIVSDTNNTSVAELQKDYKNEVKKLTNYFEENKTKLRQANKTKEDYLALKVRIATTVSNIKQDKQSIKVVQLQNEYDSLKHINNQNNESLAQLDSVFKIDSSQLVILNNEYVSLEEAKNLLFGIPIEVAHQQIESYLKDEAYSQEINEKLIKAITERDKYFLILNNYCVVSKEAHILMKATILFGERTAKKIYKSQYKPKTLKWKNDYPWIYKQFTEKEEEMEMDIYKEKNPIPKPPCKSQQK